VRGRGLKVFTNYEDVVERLLDLVGATHIIRIGVAVALLLCLAGSAAAQALPIDRLTPALPTAGERRAAEITSWVTVGVALTLDTIASIKSDRPARALGLEAIRLTSVYGVTATVKHFVHRDRPCAPACGIDAPDTSFFSMHTAFPASTIGGPRLSFSVTLTGLTGAGRVLADRHYLTDVVVGGLVGGALSRIR
jgi:membrane-associated phospholipid phosphatase